jgi:crotonobetainyl-CoA:carnitine CoA-transferase CaiB-like acyl-CoA transferase
VDHAAGHILAQGILAALLQRERTGRGEHVCVSLLQVGLALQAQPFDEYLATRSIPVRVGNSAPVTAPAGVFETSDGHIVLSASNERHWRTLCELLDQHAWLNDQRFATSAARDHNRGALTIELGRVLIQKGSSHWLAKFLGAGLSAGQVQDYRQLEASTQLAATQAIVETSDDTGRSVRHTRLPVRLAGSAPRTVSVPPRIGQHTRDVLQEIGYSTGEIASFLNAQVASAEPDV